MFLCLPEHRSTSAIREILHPVPEGGGHWSYVVKGEFRPIFIVTLLPDASDESTKYTLFSADASGLCRLAGFSEAGQIVGIDCLIKMFRSASWITRAVQEVWSERGHEKHVVNLVFRDEPTTLFEGYTLRKVDDVEESQMIQLLSISKYKAAK